MIEVYDYRFKKDKIDGYIDAKNYLNRKKKFKGKLDGKKYIDDRGNLLLILKDDNIITWSEGEEQGYLKEGKIYSTDNKLIYTFSENKNEIYDKEGKIILKLDGNVENLNDRNFFGITAHFLELFA